MVASTVALLLVSAGFVAYELVTHRQIMTSDLSSLAEIIGNQSTAALAYDDKNAAEEILSALNARKHIVAACIFKDGHVFAQYPANKSAGFFPPQPEPKGS